MMENRFNGKWEIVQMEAWDKNAIDLVEPGYIEFGNRKSGLLHLICIYADIHYQINNDKVMFSFRGDDEGDPISGRGWAKIKNDDLQGLIFIHHGDESSFSAKLIESIF